MMGKPPQFWLLVAFFMVVLPIASRLMPDSDDSRRVQLVELFRLPADVEFVAFRSPYLRGGEQELEGVVQFTPAQWEAYVGTLDTPSAWDPRGFTHGGATVLATPPPEALQWREGAYAWIKDDFASFWVGWGFVQNKELQGKPGAGSARAWRSLCWAVLGEGFEQTVAPCRDYKHAPKGLQFYVRATLEQESRRLFMYVR